MSQLLGYKRRQPLATIRSNLRPRHYWLLRLEERVRNRRIKLTEEQIQMLALRPQIPRAAHRNQRQVLDAWSRRIVGWAMAISRRQPGDG